MARWWGSTTLVRAVPLWCDEQFHRSIQSRKGPAGETPAGPFHNRSSVRRSDLSLLLFDELLPEIFRHVERNLESSVGTCVLRLLD